MSETTKPDVPPVVPGQSPVVQLMHDAIFAMGKAVAEAQERLIRMYMARDGHNVEIVGKTAAERVRELAKLYVLVTRDLGGGNGFQTWCVPVHTDITDIPAYPLLSVSTKADGKLLIEITEKESENGTTQDY